MPTLSSNGSNIKASVMMKWTKAFTLIEWLFLISIVSLLGAMIIPALNKASIEAKRLKDAKVANIKVDVCKDGSMDIFYPTNKAKFKSGRRLGFDLEKKIGIIIVSQWDMKRHIFKNEAEYGNKKTEEIRQPEMEEK